MQEIDIVVDDLGQVWGAQSWGLHKRHELIESKSNLVTYLVRNCGHIAVSKSKFSSSAHILLYPGRIGARVVTATMLELLKAEVETFYVEYLGNAPALQLVSDPDELVALLVYNTNDDCRLKRQKFFREPLSFQRLTRTDLRNLRRAYSWWEKLHGVLDDQPAVNQALRGQHYVALISKGKATFERVGGGYPNLKPLLSDVQGTDVSTQADQAYGNWVAQCLLQAAYQDEPVFELVEADVEVPGRSLRSRYQRLFLPWVTPKGLMISSSSVTLSAFRGYVAT